MTAKRAPGTRHTATGVTVVIVSYQCRALLDLCLDSVMRHGNPDGQSLPTWVVDNGSNDGTAAMVWSKYPCVTFWPARANLGFSAANNLAMRYINTEFVLILNPDVLLHEGTVRRLIELMRRRPEIGMAGCKLVRPDGSIDRACKRSFPTISGAIGHFTGVGRAPGSDPRLAQYTATDPEKPGLVDAINGAFMLIRHEAMEEVGLFDEGYWLYMEDLDFCYRFKQAGWPIWYEPSVSATHIKGGTSGAHRRARQNRAFHYGMYRFYRKFYAAERPWPVNLVVYAGIATKLLASLTFSALARSALRLRTLLGRYREETASLDAQ